LLGVILNETEIVDNILNKGNCDGNIYNAILLLIKHYHIGGNADRVDVKENIISNLEKCTNIVFKRVEWDDTISKTIDKLFRDIKIHKKNMKLVDVDKVAITINELNKINSLENKKLKKLAFVLLVYAKISNVALDRDDGWINQSYKNIFTESKVSAKGNDKKLLLHDLYKLEYISQSYKNDSTSLKINYIDNEEDSEIAFYIEDFDFVIYSYLNYMGENWKKCERCRGCFMVKNIKNTSQKYCSMCAKEVIRENDRVRKRKIPQSIIKDIIL
jgi:hypothetical protein